MRECPTCHKETDTVLLECLRCNTVSCNECRGGEHGTCPVCKNTHLFRRERYDVGEYVWATARTTDPRSKVLTITGYIVKQFRVISVGKNKVFLYNLVDPRGNLFLDKRDVTTSRAEAIKRGIDLADRVGVPCLVEDTEGGTTRVN